MAKVSILTVLVAACAIATYAIPAPNEIDWVAARAKVEEIQVEGLNKNFDKATEVANKDNLNACIDSLCFGYVVNRYHIDRIRRYTRDLEFWIYDRTLTTEKLQAALGEVRNEINRLVYLVLLPYYDLLSEPAVKRIQIYFDKATQATYRYQNDLIGIIREGEQPKLR